MRMASRQCACACDASDRQLDCTCTHKYRKKTVARQCASSHEHHDVIYGCFEVSMLSSSTCARLPRMQFEEGREQTHAQWHLRSSTNEHILSAGVYFLIMQTSASTRSISHAVSVSCAAAVWRAMTRGKTRRRLLACVTSVWLHHTFSRGT